MKDLLEIEGSEGVLIEEIAPEGLEVIVGGVIDDQFGPIVMFRLGGVLWRSLGMLPLDWLL